MNASQAELLGIDLLRVTLSPQARAQYEELASQARLERCEIRSAKSKAELRSEIRRCLEAAKHQAVRDHLSSLSPSSKAIVFAEFLEPLVSTLPAHLGTLVLELGREGQGIDAFESEPERRVIIGSFSQTAVGFRVPTDVVIFTSLPIEGRTPVARPLFNQLRARGHVPRHAAPRVVVAVAEDTFDEAVLALAACEEGVARLELEGLATHPAAEDVYRNAVWARRIAHFNVVNFFTDE